MNVEELIKELNKCNPKSTVRAVDEEVESFFVGTVKEADGFCWLWEED